MSMLPYHMFERGKGHDVELVTVWDGTGAGASGTRYLDAVEEPPRNRPARVLDFRSLSDRVLGALAAGPRTARQIANEIERSMQDVSGTLYALRQRGHVFIQGEHALDPTKSYGRRSENVYARSGAR
jgi:hypothetical protein